MIASLEGNVQLIGFHSVIVNVGGVGYEVYVTPKVQEVSKIGESVSLWTHQYVREDSLELYGFLHRSELETFEKLISVSGVGPKTALGILNMSTPDQLASAVASGNVSLLTKVSGIGKKTAERLLIELKGFMPGGHLPAPEVNSVAAGDLVVIEALESLGYSVNDARSALEQVNKEVTDTNDRLKGALKLLGRNK